MDFIDFLKIVLPYSARSIMAMQIKEMLGVAPKAFLLLSTLRHQST